MKQTARIYPLICLIDGIHLGLLLPILLFLFFSPKSTELLLFDSREWTFGLLLSLPYFVRFLSLVFFRSIADSLGLRTLFIMTVGFLTLGTFLTGLSLEIASISLLFLARILTGLGLTSLPIIALGGSFGLFNPKRSFQFQGYGITLGPLLGGIGLLPFSTVEVPFYFVTFLCLISLSIFLFTQMSEKKGLPRFTPSNHLPKWKYFKTEDLLFLTLGFLFSHMGWSIYFYDAPLFSIKAYLFSPWHFVFLFTLFCYGLQLGLGLIAGWMKRFGRKGIVVGGYILIGFMMLIQTAPKTAFFLWALSFPVGVVAGIAYTNTIEMFSALSKRTTSSDASLVAQCTQSLASALGMLFVGVFSSIKTTLPMVTGFIFICIGISFYLLGKFRNTDREEVF